MSTAEKYASKLQGARVLVLGATSGIGFCVAEAALAAGASVHIASSSPANIAAALARLRASFPGRSVSGSACDLADRGTQEANLAALFAAATGDGAHELDHAVMTAGNSVPFAPLAASDAAAFDAVTTVRLLGAMLFAKVAARHLARAAGSSLTLTGGGLAHRPVAHLGSLIPAASAAVEGLARGLAVELKPVRVNCVAPGAVLTDHLKKTSKEALEGMMQAFRKSTLVDTVGQPEDVAEAYLYLMRDRFVTGHVIQSNGGLLLA